MVLSPSLSFFLLTNLGRAPAWSLEELVQPLRFVVVFGFAFGPYSSCFIFLDARKTWYNNFLVDQSDLLNSSTDRSADLTCLNLECALGSVCLCDQSEAVPGHPSNFCFIFRQPEQLFNRKTRSDLLRWPLAVLGTRFTSESCGFSERFLLGRIPTKRLILKCKGN